jgi:hypothetical protein
MALLVVQLVAAPECMRAGMCRRNRPTGRAGSCLQLRQTRLKSGRFAKQGQVLHIAIIDVLQCVLQLLRPRRRAPI